MSFLLDGQTVVLEDYLAVQPERASELATALREGRLEAGPWFVLADELIPSGEALVRNLLAGRRTLRALRAEAPPVLYCPDSFGHPAALPELARGFDKELVILWRGFGGSRAPKGDTFWWSAPSGNRVLLYHLTRSGYELGVNLPAAAETAREKWKCVREEFGTRSTTGLALLLNGADHHARQRELAEALKVLSEVAKPDGIVPGSLTEFARELGQRAAKTKLADVRGELRDSYGFAWTLQGTLASRTPQKRRYVLRERELLRDVEPWTALAAFYGRGSRRHLTRAAWRPLLLCQPHDTLCGCSVDQVARAMDARLESVATQAEGLREDALFDLIGHEREAARLDQSRWKPVVLVRNQAARPRSGVAIIEMTYKIADVPVGPGSANAATRTGPASISGSFLSIEGGFERTEAPRAYPDNDAVVRAYTAAWIQAAPAYGVLPLAFDAAEAPPGGTRPVKAKGRLLTNGLLTLQWDAKGRLTLEDAESGRMLRGLVEWESVRDDGDLYTPSIRGRKFTGRHRSTKLLRSGTLMGSVEQVWEFAKGDERIDVRLRLVLEAGAPFVRVGVLGDNNARDHRLRIVFRTDVVRGSTVADAAFGIVEREHIKVSATEARMETPVASAPLHRYVSLFNGKRGATLFSDGLTEYETAKDRIAVTLVRSVGELSRSDIPERPGHAGWPAPTPEAQCIGPFEAEFGLMLHGPRSDATTDAIERAADDVLFPLTGETLRSALRVPEAVHGVALEGLGLSFSSAKESDDGEWLVLRCVNLLDDERAGSWRLGRVVKEAHLARLDETPLSPLRPRGDVIEFRAPPRSVVTILVR